MSLLTVDLKEWGIGLWGWEQPRRPISKLARELGLHPEAMRIWVRQDEAERRARVAQTGAFCRIRRFLPAVQRREGRVT